MWRLTSVRLVRDTSVDHSGRLTAGLAVLALRMASRRCFLTAIAVLALAILLVAMAAASGSSAQAAADALFLLWHVGGVRGR